jgi:hypothetical protein
MEAPFSTVRTPLTLRLFVTFTSPLIVVVPLTSRSATTHCPFSQLAVEIGRGCLSGL